MNELLDLLSKNYKSFYTGNDEEGWTYFSQLIEKIQLCISDKNLDTQFKNTLMIFISKFENITLLKQQKNYPLIADEIYLIYNELAKYKELN